MEIKILLWRVQNEALHNVNSIQRTRRAIVSFILFITSFRKIIRILLLDLFFGQLEPPWKSGPAKTGPAGPVLPPLEGTICLVNE